MRKSVRFVFTADKGSVFNARNVVFSRSVIITAGQFFLVELNDFARSASFFAKRVALSVASVNPNYFVGLRKSFAVFDELKNFLVVGHNIFSLTENFYPFYK
jgi:hypothetical protein